MAAAYAGPHARTSTTAKTSAHARTAADCIAMASAHARTDTGVGRSDSSSKVQARLRSSSGTRNIGAATYISCSGSNSAS